MNQLMTIDPQAQNAISEAAPPPIPEKVAWDSLSPNTRKAYRSALRKFNVFLELNPDTFHSTEVKKQISDYIIAAFISQLYENGKSPATISVALAAVKWWTNIKRTPISFELTNLQLKTIRREANDRAPGQVTGLRRDDVKRICWEAEKDKYKNRAFRDIALVRVMRDGLLRISEAVAIDVEHLQDNALFVPRSKTDQHGEGVHLYLTHKTRWAIAAYREATGIDAGALFRTVFKHSKRLGTRLNTDQARAIIKKRAKAAGITTWVSGHSLRVGSAIDLAKGGASVVEMQQAGRWHSPSMPAHYAGAVITEQGAVARIFEKD